jgi:aminoglycoside 3-N-acetyltransferase
MSAQLLIKRLRNKLEAKKILLLKKLRIFKKDITKEVLLKDLRLSGIESGDTVMVHASLSKIGNVKGGASTVIRALIEKLGENGNLVMPAFSYISSMVNTSLISNYVFEPLSTPAVVGKIPEEFRQWFNVERSIHPTHSVCAHGPQANIITAGHLEAPTNFGEGTPFHKIRQLKGKVCGIGINIGPVTIYHSAEDFYPELFRKVYLPELKPIKVLVNGIEIIKPVYIHNPEFHRIRIDKNIIIESWMRNHLKEIGILHEGTFGSTNIWWMDIQELFDELISMARRGISIYKTPGI